MDAAPDVQLRLLDLQAADSAIDRLAARRRTLPEIAQLAEIETRLAQLHNEAVGAETEARDITREQTRLEGDVDQVRARAVRDQQRLDAGQVGSPRELENLQSEIASLARRQGVLEDELLEVMERREEAETRGSEARRQEADLDAERDALTAAKAAAESDIDAETASQRATRDALAAELPADLVALYERVRAQHGGVGAAPLVRRRCEGCHLELGPAALSAVRGAPETAVLRCEECQRILVRTAESGL